MFYFSLLFTLIVLIIANFTDIKKGIIPDCLTFPSIIIGIIFQYKLNGILSPIIIIATVIFLLILFNLLMKGALGGGDIKLFIFMGLMSGLPHINYMILLTLLLAVLYQVIKKMKGNIILGPFILTSFILYQTCSFLIQLLN